MAKFRTIPRKSRQPSLRNVLMVDATRGVLRVRKWPKKRGTPKSELQRFWIDWFRQANLLAKYADGMAQALAIKLTKGSGLYPRDIMLQAMRGRLYTWDDAAGRRWYPVAAIEDVSKTLDVLAQIVGSVLVRATDRWRTPPPTTVGDVLTYQGASAPPIWAPFAGPGGVIQQLLAGTPLVPDGTKALYDFDVTTYADIIITLDTIGFAASDEPWLRFSTDGGVSYKAGASDYYRSFVNDTGFGSGNKAFIPIGWGPVSTGHQALIQLTDLQAGRASCHLDTALSAASGGHIAGRARFDGPITHIRLLSKNGNNFNAGTLRLVGVVAA